MAVSTLADLPLPPGSRSAPVVGETLQWVRDPLRFAQERYERYGMVWRTHLLGRPCAVLLGPEANKFILGTHTELFSSRAGWGKPITSLIGGGLSLIDGGEHRRHRQMIQPLFHGAMLSRYFDVMQGRTTDQAATWVGREPLKLFDAFKQLSFDIAARLMLGARNGAEAARFHQQFHVFTGGLFAPPAWKVPGTPYAKAWRASIQLRQTLQRIITERRKSANQANDDILGLLLAARDADNQSFTDAELIDELLVLLWAGHDTITSLLTWTMYELLHDADVYRRAVAEQTQVVGNGPLQLAHLKQMPLLDRILREAERLHPPAPGGFRGVVTPFEYSGYRIPAGWTVMYSIVFTHHMPELWRDPLRFDPDRFGPPHNEGHKPFNLIGFGGGPRVCVGLAFAQMQMRIIVSHLLRNFRFELLPRQSFKAVPVPTKMPQDGLLVRVHRQ